MAHRAEYTVGKLDPADIADPATREWTEAAIELTAANGWDVSLAEPGTGSEVPTRRRRLAIHDDQGRKQHRVLVFGDLAHRGFVWSWREGYGSGGSRYVEYRLPGRGPQLLHGLKMARSRPAGGASAAATEVLARCSDLMSAMPGSAKQSDPLAPVLDAVDRCDSPDRLRKLGRFLISAEVWYPEAAPLAEPLNDAPVFELLLLTLRDRLRALVDDNPARRPERLSDARQFVRWSDAVDRGNGALSPPIRHLVVQRILHVIRSPAAMREATVRLLDWVGIGEAWPLLDLNCWMTPASGGDADPLAVACLERAWRGVRRDRLLGRGAATEFDSADRMIADRRRAVGCPILRPVTTGSLSPAAWDFEVGWTPPTRAPAEQDE